MVVGRKYLSKVYGGGIVIYHRLTKQSKNIYTNKCVCNIDVIFVKRRLHKEKEEEQEEKEQEEKEEGKEEKRKKEKRIGRKKKKMRSKRKKKRKKRRKKRK
jgi:hypothetical protein